MAVVAEKLKDEVSIMDDELPMSTQTRQEFVAHAIKDQETGELFMGPHEFIHAVAPEGEDYVSTMIP